MTNDYVTIRRIKHKNNIENSAFLKAYVKLLLQPGELTDVEKFYLLKLAIIFLSAKEDSVEKLGYRIILRYSNWFKDYKPLYDVALTRNYVPIAKFIENKHFDVEEFEQSFSRLFLSAYQENFKTGDENSTTYRSFGQLALRKFAEVEDNLAIVAPTSYGKSEMLIGKIESNLTKKICVIVPSKALLAQTKANLLRNPIVRGAFRKIITHPDMYRAGDTSFLAVLTQERLLRMLQRNKELSIDLVLVDEAHNLLEDAERAHLLAQVLLILHKRDENFLINFFTPFLADVNNLSIKNYDIDIKHSPVGENMKIERFFTYNLEAEELNFYDQFLDRHFLVQRVQYPHDVSFVQDNRANKNIVYLNRPVKAEEVALRLAQELEPIQINFEMQKIIDAISDLIHPAYNLINAIKSGVVYHHGGIPEMIRLYIEDIYSKNSEFKFIVTTSTLLEGVNIPAERIFILSPVKGRNSNLTASQFRNLIGRVCRFREVFHKTNGDLRLLEPEIYLVKGKYAPKNFAPLTFLKQRVNSSIIVEDDVENPLLKNSNNEEGAKEVLEYLENMEPGSSGLEGVTYPESDIGKLCFENNIHDFNIIRSEENLIKNLRAYKENNPTPINGPDLLMDALAAIFFEGITFNQNTDNISRLRDTKARNFYKLFINWRSKGAPYSWMIKSFMDYWNQVVANGDPMVYVGSKWGEYTREGHQPLWVNMTEKNELQRINLAIARIKEEQEFVDFNVLKYLEVLSNLNLVEGEFYDQVKYGTSNQKIICMLKNGFSMELAKLLTSEAYDDFLELDLDVDIVFYGPELITAMRENNENEILIFEAEGNV